MENRVPFPASLVTAISPWWFLTIWRQIESPSPTPPPVADPDALRARRRDAHRLEDVADDRGEAVDLAVDDLEALDDLGVGDAVLEQELEVAGDRVERRAELVGDRGGHLAERGELLLRG